MRIFVLAVLVLSLCFTAWAENMFETRREASQRVNAERYEQRTSSPYGEPLGGYNETLNDSTFKTWDYEPMTYESPFNY